MSEPISQTDRIKLNSARLEEALLAKHPTKPTLQREMHKQLKEDPATVTLLAEEEIATVVRGLESQTNTFIAASMVSPKSAASKALKKVTSNDLGFD